MWLATRFGFYSVVNKGAAGYHVRARTRRDLQNLIEAAGLKTEIQRRPEADYLFHIEVNAKELREVMHLLATAVNYPSFRSKIAATPDQHAKLRAYHKIWDEMAALEQGADLTMMGDIDHNPPFFIERRDPKSEWRRLSHQPQLSTLKNAHAFLDACRSQAPSTDWRIVDSDNSIVK